MNETDMAATHAAAFVQSRPWTEAEFSDLLAQKFCHAVGSAQCFALIRVIADEAELLTIATHPAMQRRGLARACMTQWLNLAADLGATRAFLDVAADNAPALALYASCGFEPCGLRPGYYPRADGGPVGAILMARDLTQEPLHDSNARDPKSS